MTHVEIHDDRLTIHLSELDQVLAARRRIDIPTRSIVSVEAAPSSGRLSRLVQAVAGLIPPALAPTTFYQQSGRRWGQAPAPERTLELRLIDGRYERVVLEIENARTVAARIRRACRAASAPPVWRTAPGNR
ncbi:MAG: hypothetical protein U0531_06555 [Dehalococcoidia bacterium]